MNCQSGTVTIVVEAVGVPPPTTWTVERFVLEDTRFELRVGAEAKWGYDIGQTVKSDEVDILITVSVGDTIVFDRLSSSSSRSTMPHAFTIAGMGIDILLNPGDRQEPYELLLDQVGTFTVTDSVNPTQSGTVTIVVE